MENNSTSTMLSINEFERLSRFIYSQCGIKLTSAKKSMVEARLRKRLRDLNLNSYSEYCDYLFSRSSNDSEVTNMVDVITTNKTDFFREPKQFTYLAEAALPELLQNNKIGIKRPLRIWSAGCSTGEEPYTLSIVINEFAKTYSDYSFGILATDISTRVLEKAKLAVYEEERVESIETEILKKYFLRSKDPQKKLVRLVPQIRNSINFQWLNLMIEDFGLKERFDIIFCRNVIIYFDKPTQDKLIAKLINHLNPGGYLFLGHSESIFSNDLPITQMMASTYRVTG